MPIVENDGHFAEILFDVDGCVYSKLSQWVSVGQIHHFSVREHLVHKSGMIGSRLCEVY